MWLTISIILVLNLCVNTNAVGKGVSRQSSSSERPSSPFYSVFPFYPNLFRANVPAKKLIKHDGSELWSFSNTTSPKILKDLKKMFGGQIWNLNQDGIDMLFDSENVDNAKEFLKTTDVTYNVMINDMESAIKTTFSEFNNTENPNNNKPWLNRKNTKMNWIKYHDVITINEFLNTMLDTYPDITQIITIGRTDEKRAIKVFKISNGNPDNQAIFVDGGMQGRDWISPAAVTYTISRLLWNMRKKPNYMQNVDWYFLPLSNPDGYHYSRTVDRLWIKNRRSNGECFGVNINRNFGYSWSKKGSTENACKETYRGADRFSESESRAMKNILRNISSKLVAYISIGGYGQTITYPWADGDFVPKNGDELHNIGTQAMMNIRKLDQSNYRVGSSYRLNRSPSGGSADWVEFAFASRFVYNLRLQDLGRFGYLLPPEYIVSSSTHAYEVIKTIAEAAFTTQSEETETDIEEPIKNEIVVPRLSLNDNYEDSL